MAPVRVALLAIVGIALALTAVARSHTLAGRAQTGADAAALAALDGAESNVLDVIRRAPPGRATSSPSGVCPGPARDAATHYAAANQTSLVSCVVDGPRATVEVQSLGTVEVPTEDDTSSSAAVTRSATAELVIEWKIGDRRQTEPPNPLPTASFLHAEARRQGGVLLQSSGLLRLDPCEPNAERPLGAGIAVGVRAALHAAEEQLGEPVGFRPGWTEPCQPPPDTGTLPVLVDQRSVLRVENPALLVTVLGPDVPLCQPYPAHPDHFALAREPVCGGRAGVLTHGFPNLDRLVETKRILVG